MRAQRAGRAERRHRAAPIGNAALRYVAGQQLPSWNKTILDRWVKRAFEQADETRPVIAHSGVLPHLPQLDGTDSHLYFGWYHGDERDIAGVRRVDAADGAVRQRVRRPGGARSRRLHGAERWPDLDWAMLQERHGCRSMRSTKFVPPSTYATFDEWREATQRYQATLLRHHIETLRRLKYRPAGGFCFFMFNDACPMVSWSVLDHERHPEARLSSGRRCLPTGDRGRRPLAGDGDGRRGLALDVHVVSDVRRLLEDTVCTAKLSWPGGSHAWRWGGDVPPDSCVRVGTIQFVVADTPGELWLDLIVEHGDEIATNRDVCTIVR